MNDTTTGLLGTLDVFKQAGEILSASEEDTESRRFYQHLSARCLLLYDQVTEFRGSNFPTHFKVETLLAQFESAVKLEPAVISTASFEPKPEPRLHFLTKARLGVLCGDEHDAWVHLLDFGSPEERRELINTLKSAEMTLKLVETSQSNTDTLAPTKTRLEPVLAVPPAASVLFQVLEKCRKCQCDPPHSYAAMLCLQTHRALRDSRDLDFDMFLALEQAWREAHVRTIPKSTVRVQLVDSEGAVQSHLGDYDGINRAQVKRLCLPMRKIEARPTYRLEFLVEDGLLWKLRSDRVSFTIDKATRPVSLQNLIAKSSSWLTEKVKRILSIFLGYALLHLSGTPWFQSSWSSDRILFIKTASGIPLKPYIVLQLEDTVAIEGGTLAGYEGSDDEWDPDDDLLSHPFPPAVTLAIMLIEIHMARPIESLAQLHGIEMHDGIGDDARSIVTAQIFEKCKGEISEQSRAAIENCLSTYLWLDPNGSSLGESELRSVVYSEIVQHLENELEHTFNYLTIEQLDTIAQGLDFSNYGFPMQKNTYENQEAHNTSPQPSFENGNSQSASRSNKHKTTRNRYLERQKRRRINMSSQEINSIGSITWKSIHQEGFPLCFDDQSSLTEIDPSARIAYIRWKDVYTDTIEHFLKGVEAYTPVKIAILDTGLDQSHPDYEANSEPIKEIRSFLTGSHDLKPSSHDDNGHGTHICGIILDYAPDAHVYTAKIAEHDKPDAMTISKAIDHAVDVWDVDIISMSFGFSTRQVHQYENLERSLQNAKKKDVLVFAAASNNGANTQRAFPARHENVICVHSTDTDGVPSRFNPPPILRGDNFATVGEAVQSSWPVHLCDKRDNELYIAFKSGSSFATAIAAATGAFLLQYARMKLSADDAKRLKQSEIMKALLRAISTPHMGYDYIALSRHPDNLFGKDETFIKSKIKDVLRNT